MRLVIQRVSRASVTTQDDGKIVGKIDKGLLVLFGAKKGDTEEKVHFLTEKLSKLRIMSDENGKMNLSIKDVDGKILFVSQFTLYANTSDGNRPSFIEAEDPPKAEKLYKLFISDLRDKGIDVETGRFGSYMEICTELDGPVTIIVEN